MEATNAKLPYDSSTSISSFNRWIPRTCVLSAWCIRRTRTAVTLSRTLLCLLLTPALTFAAEPSEAKLKALYDAHEWFRLRDAVSKDSPRFYQGAVAAAFQDVRQAEKSLRLVIQSQPGSEQAHDALELLASAYQRAARYHEALALVDEALAQKPNDPDWKNARVLFSSFAGYPTSPLPSAVFLAFDTR